MLFKNKRCHSFFAGLAVCVGILALSDHVASSQERPYFVDGFHGGVYGHYPMATYTRFLVDQFEANPAWRFCLEIEPETWDTVAVRTPEDYKRFSRIVNSPRVEFTNPTYAQPYMYNISGESIIRQMQYGMRKIHSHFPDVEFLTYSVEEPCFTSCLPQILVQLGFKYASTNVRTPVGEVIARLLAMAWSIGSARTGLPLLPFQGMSVKVLMRRQYGRRLPQRIQTHILRLAVRLE